MKDRLITSLQYLVPHHGLSRWIGLLAASENEVIRKLFIRQFAQMYNVDMSEALEENLYAYRNFNAFFTRALKPEARPIAANRQAVICPADGAISQIGHLQNDRILQAKGHRYSTVDLLGGSVERAAPFLNGSFATIYLSPRDYHRVHMPLEGRLREMVYIPGKLFSVNQRTAAHVPELFARNERMVAIFETEAGPMAYVMVGAMIVAGIETVWAGRIAPSADGLPKAQLYHGDDVVLGRGAELGRFFLGSTVILLFPDEAIHWGHLHAGDAVRMGQSMGEWRTIAPR